jgi:integrase
MASAWINKRPRKTGGFSFRVWYRTGGGHESPPRYAGSFPTKAAALERKKWVTGELAAMRLPDLSALAAPATAPTLREKAEEWQASRKDVRESTRIHHRTALRRVFKTLGARPFDTITPDDVQDVVNALEAEGKARASIRKSVTVLAMVLDYARVRPNPARDPSVKLPREELEVVQPPPADHVEAVAWLLPADYLLGLLVLDATGARIGEVEGARVSDFDETEKRWLVRPEVAKTRRARWVQLPDDLFDVVVERLPAREDRDLTAPLFPIGSTDRLRMAIGRGCRDAAVPAWSPHDLRHRRISLLHHQGVSWAEIGAQVGQRNLSVTADTYTHILFDYRELDRAKLLKRVRTRHTSGHTSELRTA